MLCKSSNQIIFSKHCQLPRAGIKAEISAPVENEEMHNKCTEKSILSILLVYIPSQFSKYTPMVSDIFHTPQ